MLSHGLRYTCRNRTGASASCSSAANTPGLSSHTAAIPDRPCCRRRAGDHTTPAGRPAPHSWRAARSRRSAWFRVVPLALAGCAANERCDQALAAGVEQPAGRLLVVVLEGAAETPAPSRYSSRTGLPCSDRVTPRRSSTSGVLSTIAPWSTPGWTVTITARSVSPPISVLRSPYWGSSATCGSW